MEESTDLFGSIPDNNTELSAKLVKNTRTLGPVERVSNSKDLTKAAAKLVMDNGLKVTSLVEPKAPTKRNKVNESFKVEVSDIQEAFAILQAWDKRYPNSGSDKYLDKANRFYQHRNEVYSSFGITSGNSQPMLTQEQKDVYNKEMSPFAFKYVTLYLSVKVEGNKAIKSRSYRRLAQGDFDPQATIYGLKIEARNVTDKMKVTVK